MEKIEMTDAYRAVQHITGNVWGDGGQKERKICTPKLFIEVIVMNMQLILDYSCPLEAIWAYGYRIFNKADMLDSKSVQDKSAMADLANVPQDGYEALMAGKENDCWI